MESHTLVVHALAAFAMGTPGSVLRGGSWNNNDNNARSANRNNNDPTNTNNNVGFRCARDA